MPRPMPSSVDLNLTIEEFNVLFELVEGSIDIQKERKTTNLDTICIKMTTIKARLEILSRLQ